MLAAAHIQTTCRAAAIASVVTPLDGNRAIESWQLPVEAAFLTAFFRYVFSHYWQDIVFGPIIEGAAYEMTCPNPPNIAGPDDGYLTVSFGVAHFHLCVGGHSGRLAHLRQPSRAELFRRLDRQGAPISWGFQMENGAGHPMISIFFPSPFVTIGDRMETEPLWERLHVWRDITQRFLGLEADEFDQTSIGYVDGNY
jgi:hypothetical protein